MVIGGGERHHLAQAELGQDTGIGRLVAGGVAECTDADDGALPGHEAGHRLGGAQRPRIGEGDGRPGEIVGGDFAGVDLADEVLVGDDEGAEVKGVGVTDARDEQGARSIALLLVDRQAEADMLVVDHAGLAGAVDIVHEGCVERRDVAERAHDRVADEMGEADLGAGGAGQLVVEDLAVDLEQAGGHGAHAGRRGHAETGLHVGHNACGGTPEHDGVPGAFDGRRGRCGPRRGCCGGEGGRCGRRRERCAPVVGEELAPALAHRVRIDQEPVVHVIDQPRIRAERARCDL